VVSRSLKACKFCSNIKDVLNRKRRRVKITKCDKRITLSNLSTENKKKLLLLRNKYYKTEKAKKRAKYVAYTLKAELMNCMAKSKEVSIQTVEKLLKEKKFLTFNLPQ